MRCCGGRVIGQELLDTADPSIVTENLRDLVRINRFFGGHRILKRMFSRHVRRSEAFSVLDVGAASGDMARAIKKHYPRATVVSLDRRVPYLAPAPSPRVGANAFQIPFRDRSFDFVFSSLFLHHFSDDEVTYLLSDFSAKARRAVLAIDLERNPIPYYFLPGTRWLMKWGPFTVHDGKLSVEAAFRARELDRLARAAGLKEVRVRRHYPWFRLTLEARV